MCSLFTTSTEKDKEKLNSPYRYRITSSAKKLIWMEIFSVYPKITEFKPQMWDIIIVLDDFLVSRNTDIQCTRIHTP